MLYNYFKVAFRNILKHKVFSIINIFGLAISMTLCLLIILILADQKSYDNFHEYEDRLYRIVSKNSRNLTFASSPVPLGETIVSEATFAEKTVRLFSFAGGDVSYNDKAIPLRGFYAETALFEVFSFPLVAGDKLTALKAPFTVVITEESAQKLFGSAEQALGKVLKISDRGLHPIGIDLNKKSVELGEFQVTGVLNNKGLKSHIKFDFLLSYGSLVALAKDQKISFPQDDWEHYYTNYTYFKANENVTREAIEASLTQIAKNAYIDSEEDASVDFVLEPISEITPGKFMSNMLSFRMPIEAMYFLGGLALLVMLSACFNYMNLLIARALGRAKEVGIRKVVGATRTQVFFQFIAEAVAITLMALLLAVVLLQLLKPAFSGLWLNKYLQLELNSSIWVTFGFIGFGFFVSLVAGILPAIYLSAFKPATVLKGSTSFKLFKRVTFRKVLIVFQFSLSLFFITSAMLIAFQFEHIMQADYGFEKDNIINIKLNEVDFDLAKNTLENYSGVVGVSGSNIIPATGMNYGLSIKKNIEDEESISVDLICADGNFIENLEMEIVVGTNFPDELPTKEERYVILSEAATKKLGFDSPNEAVGKLVAIDSNLPESNEDRKMIEVEVIGVIKNIQNRMLVDEKGAMAIRFTPTAFRYANVKIQADKAQEIVAYAEGIWKKHDPTHTFDYEFFDQQLASSYSLVKDVVAIVAVFSILAITISCLGLLGMVMYTTETRRKEIGIRKVLGAEVSSVVLLLSKTFMWLLLIATSLAVPFSYFLHSLWLQEIAYRVDFGIEIIGGSILIMILLGLLTIAPQTIKAALTNPVKSLRSE